MTYVASLQSVNAYGANGANGGELAKSINFSTVQHGNTGNR